MIYTEEDLEQAYAMGYNEAVDDVNEYIDQESTEFSLDESYDEDYSAVEDMICNETSRVNKLKHNDVIEKRLVNLKKKYGENRSYLGYAEVDPNQLKRGSKDLNDAMRIDQAIRRNRNGSKNPSPYYHVTDRSAPESERMKLIKSKIKEMNERKMRKNAPLAFRGRRK